MDNSQGFSFQEFDADLLIELVKNYPPLYDVNIKSYRRKNVCVKAWKEIASKMGKDVLECKSVWGSLRSSYARHLQNIKKNEMLPDGKKRRPWYLSEKMSFLQNFMQLPSNHRRRPRFNTEIQKQNDSMISEDTSDTRNVLSFLNSENSVMDEVFSIKSDNSETTLSIHDENEINNEDPHMDYETEICEFKLDSKPYGSEYEEEKEPRNIQLSKELKMSSDESKTSNDYVRLREESTLMFFQSILFDLRKLPDRKLRLFKEDVLKNMNKFLDEKDEIGD